MRLYLPGGADFWGDYGQVLINGLGPWYCGREKGLIAIHRTGPFIPPISFPSGGIVVADDFRRLLEGAFSGLQFQPVVKKKIVLLKWETWDRTTPMPKVFPTGGEPANYVIRKRHSEKAASEMGPLWELVVQPILEYRTVSNQDGSRVYYVLESSWNGAHFLSLQRKSSIRPVITEKAKDFLEQHCGEWLNFREVVVVKELPNVE